MSRYDDLDAAQLRAELDDATDQALKIAKNLGAAVQAGEWPWATAVAACALPAALHRVEHIRTLLRLGVTA